MVFGKTSFWAVRPMRGASRPSRNGACYPGGGGELRSKRVRSIAVAVVVAAGLALVVSACGGGGGSNNNNTTGATTISGQRTFPVLKTVWGTTDYMDPGLSYRLESRQIFQDVYL